jgi:hypothetical protein
MRRDYVLEPDQIELLRAVAADRVARHRQRIPESPATGRDLEHQPESVLASQHRRVGPHLRPLSKLGLVELVQGEPTDTKWPYQLTEAGRLVLEALDEQAATADQEEAP